MDNIVRATFRNTCNEIWNCVSINFFIFLGCYLLYYSLPQYFNRAIWQGVLVPNTSSHIALINLFFLNWANRDQMVAFSNRLSVLFCTCIDAHCVLFWGIFIYVKRIYHNIVKYPAYCDHLWLTYMLTVL